MLKKISRTASLALRAIPMIALLLCLPGIQTSAQTCYTNPDTGFSVVLEDDADLLTVDEEELLAEQMQEITAWGNVAFISINRNSGTAAEFSESCYTALFGRDSGMLFLIDMDNRKLWIKADGKLSRTITDSYCDTLTDNVYRYATRGDYYNCASKLYGQTRRVLSGGTIAQPMKYISNALLAVILALLLNYAVMRYISRNPEPESEDWLRNMKSHYHIANMRADYINTTKHYDPVSSGSSGGGGGGGGGSSGSSGGHSF